MDRISKRSLLEHLTPSLRAGYVRTSAAGHARDVMAAVDPDMRPYQSGEVDYNGRFEMQRPPRKNAIVRGRRRLADPLQRAAQAQGLGLRDRKAINHAQGAHPSGASPRRRNASMVRDGTEFAPA
jgi:hypothetical protein